MKLINIVNHYDLGEINNLIHDCSFDINAIENDNNKLKIKISVYNDETILKRKHLFFKQFEVKDVEYVLCIYGVKTYSIVDPCKIGIYCFNKINYNSKNCSFSILCAEPIEIIVNVSYFKVSLSKTGKIIRIKKKWGVLGIDS